MILDGVILKKEKGWIVLGGGEFKNEPRTIADYRGLNSGGRANWVLMFLFLIGMVVLVGAVAPTWTGYSVNYTTSEDNVYYHNFSANITDFANDVSFEILPSDTNRLYWTNATGTYNFSSGDVISKWILMTNSSTGNLTINATYDNQTGYFIIPIQATNISDTSVSPVANFKFMVNATNDYPQFTTDLSVGNNWTTVAENYTVVAADEEGHYPLNFSLTSVSCTHGASYGIADDTECDIFSLVNISNTTAEIGLDANDNGNQTGVYVFNLSITEAGHSCPHAYCNASAYEVNLVNTTQVTLTVLSALSINVTNCTGASLVEDVQFNCTVNVTTVGVSDSINISTIGAFRTDSSSPDNSSWFYPNVSNSAASNFVLSIPVSVTPSKADVGNWTINFSVSDGGTAVAPEEILLYVNWTEESPSLDAISDKVGIYENTSFGVNAYDNDLLILDGSVRDENFTYSSNTSWVSVEESSANEGNNYITATVSIDFDYAKANDFGDNNSVRINVSDAAGNMDSQIFIIEILNDTAPNWSLSLSDPVAMILTEDANFVYNVSVNVSDDEGDSLTFYYANVSGEFCSLNASTFNSSGMINFTALDCDVGEHNVTIIVGDGKLNSSAKQFNFTVGNVADAPTVDNIYIDDGDDTTIAAGNNESLSEGTAYTFVLIVGDDDFLIPSGQEGIFYNESLTVDVNITNSSSGVVFEFFEFSSVGFDVVSLGSASYNASFTPVRTQVGNFTVVVNITDNSSSSVTRTFFLNVTATSDAPNLTAIANQSFTVHDVLSFTVSATDDEDDADGLNLNYSISNVTAGAPSLTIGNESGIVSFDFDSNESYAGIWEYNVTVNDSAGQTDVRGVYVYVYGNSTLISPALNYVFNGTESVASVLNFSINHSVANNLTYEFWVDSISCSLANNSDCSYGNLSLRESFNSFGSGSAYNWSFTPSYTDESYGNYKNLTVRVYPNTTALNSTQLVAVASNFSFKLNVSHTNAPVSIVSNIQHSSGTFGSTPIDIELGSYFSDADYSDSYYVQDVNFNITTSAGNSIIRAESNVAGSRLPWNGTIGGWSLQFYGEEAGAENVTIIANDSFGAVSNGPFTVTFAAPVTTTVVVPSSGGGSRTKLKHYSLKLLVPQDVVISERNYIDIPFGVQNNGQVDLSGISLGSLVQFNDLFSDDVTISLDDDYIDMLKIGQSENFSMRIEANTGRTGKYKATIFANVTSPKFSDWADFYIEIKKANESEAEQILIFTEKLIADNPECLELTELINRAREAFEIGDYSKSLDLAEEVVSACENSIKSGEQIRYGIDGFVGENFYYISFATLVIFFIGFVFYIYKRVRFNKSGVDEYV